MFMPGAGFPILLQELAEDLAVFVRHAARVDREPLARFEIAQLARFLEREIDLRRIEGLENDHVVPLLAQVRERLDDRGFVAEQIGNHHDHRAPPHRAGNLMQRLRDARATARAGRLRLHMLEHVVEMLKRIPRIHAHIHLVRVQKQPHGIARLHDHVSERGREMARELEFGRAGAGAVGHGGAAIQSAM